MSSFDSGSDGGSPSQFVEQYNCSSTSVAGRDVEVGDKIILPPSALDKLARMNVEYPMLFEVTNNSIEKRTHCGVLEFSADEGRCYMPFWMMQNLLMEEGSLVTIKNVSLSKATFIKLRALSVDFLKVSNHRALLKVALRKFTCLTVGDTICIPYSGKNFYLDVREVQPNGCASIIETDCNDLEEPMGCKDSKYAQYEENKKDGTSSVSSVSSPVVANDLLKKRKLDAISPIANSTFCVLNCEDINLSSCSRQPPHTSEPEYLQDHYHSQDSLPSDKISTDVVNTSNESGATLDSYEDLAILFNITGSTTRIEPQNSIFKQPHDPPFQSLSDILQSIPPHLQRPIFNIAIGIIDSHYGLFDYLACQQSFDIVLNGISLVCGKFSHKDYYDRMSKYIEKHDPDQSFEKASRIPHATTSSSVQLSAEGATETMPTVKFTDFRPSSHPLDCLNVEMHNFKTEVLKMELKRHLPRFDLLLRRVIESLIEFRLGVLSCNENKRLKIDEVRHLQPIVKLFIQSIMDRFVVKGVEIQDANGIPLSFTATIVGGVETCFKGFSDLVLSNNGHLIAMYELKTVFGDLAKGSGSGSVLDQTVCECYASELTHSDCGPHVHVTTDMFTCYLSISFKYNGKVFIIVTPRTTDEETCVLYNLLAILPPSMFNAGQWSKYFESDTKTEVLDQLISMENSSSSSSSSSSTRGNSCFFSNVSDRKLNINRLDKHVKFSSDIDWDKENQKTNMRRRRLSRIVKVSNDSNG